MNNTPEEILQRIKEANSIALSLHLMPDGDSLGSSTALAYVFEKHFDKKITIVSKDTIGTYLEPFLAFHDIAFGKTLDDIDADLYVVCDGTKLFRFGVEKKIAGNDLLFIDHHNSEKNDDSYSFVFPEQSSTCSIVFDLVKAWDISFDEELAKRLIVGMFTDTGGFKYGKSLKDDIHKLNFLLENTAIDYKDMLDHLTAVSYKHKKLLGLVLQNLEISESFGLSTVSYDEGKQLGLTPLEMRGGIGALQDIKELDIVCTLVELNLKTIKGSFRSKKGEARAYAEKLGGGGHDNAAAFILENTSLANAKKKVLEIVNN